MENYSSEGLKVTVDIDGPNAIIDAEVLIKNNKEGQKLSFTIKDNDKKVVAEKIVDAQSGKTEINLKDVHLWHGKKDPYLYTIDANIIQDDEIIDTVLTIFGCRTFYVDSEKDFFLNDESYPLRGVARHQDF